ncbi:MAG: hypothetical protein AAB438_01330 [Patescibacteria group bacterium]
MYIYLSLFFISLFSITFMVMRRVVLQKDINTQEDTELILDVPDLEEIKVITIRKFKIYGYIVLVSSLRIYVKSSHLFKNKYSEVKDTVKNLHNKYVRKNKKVVEKKEVSKFLKMMGDYKRKIRTIKEKIKEEEGLN